MAKRILYQEKKSISVIWGKITNSFVYVCLPILFGIFFLNACLTLDRWECATECRALVSQNGVYVPFAIWPVLGFIFLGEEVLGCILAGLFFSQKIRWRFFIINSFTLLMIFVILIVIWCYHAFPFLPRQTMNFWGLA